MVSWRIYVRYTLARGLPAASSMLMTLLCVRALEPQAYGQYALVLSAVLMAAGFAAAVSGQSMLRLGLALTAPERHRALVMVPLLLSVFALPLVWLVQRHEGPGALAVAFALALLPLSALLDTRRSLFVAAGQADRVLRLDGWRSLLALLFALAAFAVGLTGPGVPLAALAAAALLALWIVPVTLSMPPGAAGRVDLAYLRYGGWFALWVLVQGAMLLAERHLVSGAGGLAQAGLYAARADVLTAICGAFGSIAGSALLPRYLEVADRSDPASEAALLRVGLVTTGLAALAGGALLVLVQLLPAAWVGPTLRGEPALSLTVLVAAVLWLLAVFVHKPVELGGRTDWMCFCILVAAATFAAVALIGLRWAGPAQASLSVAVAKAIAALVYIALVHRLGARVSRAAQEVRS